LQCQLHFRELASSIVERAKSNRMESLRTMAAYLSIAR
jgi:hypothetical protein